MKAKKNLKHDVVESTRCPIEGCSEDCKLCDGESTTWEEHGQIKECVFVTVWKARKKPTKSSPYIPLVEGDEN